MNSKWSKCLFVDFVIFEDKLVFYNYQNDLMLLDLNNDKVSYFDNIKIKKGPTEKMVKSGERLVALSTDGTQIGIYDLNTKAFSYIIIDCQGKGYDNYIGAVSYKEKVYVFPRYRNFILEMDAQEGKVWKTAHDFYSQIDKNKACICQYRQNIYFFEQGQNRVLKYNMETNGYERKKISQILGKVVSVEYYEADFYLLYEDGEIIKWNEEKDTIESVIGPVIQENTEYYFFKCIVAGNYIWLLPSLGEDIYVYHIDSKSLSIYDNYPDYFEYLKLGWGKYISFFEYKNITYCGMHTANCILAINNQTGKEKWIYPDFPSIQEEIYFWTENFKNIGESDISLAEFINNIDEKHQKKYKRDCVGNNIWKALKL